MPMQRTSLSIGLKRVVVLALTLLPLHLDRVHEAGEGNPGLLREKRIRTPARGVGEKVAGMFYF